MMTLSLISFVYLTIYPSKVDNSCPTFLWQFKAGTQFRSTLRRILAPQPKAFPNNAAGHTRRHPC
ncbi:hypothetical protein MASSI9I_51281 [Massilia sp. 9I]|nr:hypothetical protein MASSI9I_51281 [Massilia sp. 9I]